MSVVQAAEVRLYLADGAISHPVDRGCFVGGGLLWDDEMLRFRDFAQYDPAAAQVPLGELYGVTYEEGLKAAVLRWAIRPTDIDLDFWLGRPTIPVAHGVFARARSLERGETLGRWRVVRPGWESGATYLQQYDTAAGDYELVSEQSLPANPKFAVSLYREATADPEEGATLLPYIYTGFGFGGQWQVRLPKWRPAELWKLVGGQWKLVGYKDWSAEKLYGDSLGEEETLITVMALDGKLLIKSSVQEDSWVYADPQGRAVTVAAGPVALIGNGGAAYFGLHQVAFAQGSWNLLLARDRTTLDRAPTGLPEMVCTGSKGPKTWARAYLAADDGSELSGPQRTFRLGVALWSEDGTDTPVVKCAGLRVAPVTEAGPMQWQEVTADFQGASGGWSCDLEERRVTQSYTIELDNSSGRYGSLRGNRLVTLHVGRRGSEGAGEGASWAGDLPVRRVLSLAEVQEATAESLARGTVTLQTIDLLTMLEEIECGDRAPLDGLTVAQAIREILSWGHVRPEQMGTIHDSGRRLPTSSWDTARQLGQAGVDVGGALDTESGAAAKLRPDLSVWGALRWAMNFDYNTFLVCYEDGLIYYVQPSATVMRQFRVTASPSAEDEIRRALSFRPRLREGKTSVCVGGRERKSGRPLRSRALDQEALRSVASKRFRGYDVTDRIEDENLNEQRLVNLRCRHRFEWLRRLRDMVSYGVIGQHIRPVWRVGVGEVDCYVMNVQERVGRDGQWEMELDVVTA